MKINATLWAHVDTTTRGLLLLSCIALSIRGCSRWCMYWPYIVRVVLPVIGCEDIELPTDVWTERVDFNHMTVHCNSSLEIWHLTCRDHVWVGDSPFNCTVTDRHGRTNVISLENVGLILFPKELSPSIGLHHR